MMLLQMCKSIKWRSEEPDASVAFGADLCAIDLPLHSRKMTLVTGICHAVE